MSRPRAKSDFPSIRITRREFVKIGGATVSGSLACSLLPALAAPPSPQKDGAYPVVTVAPLSAIRRDDPLSFTYPDASSPAVRSPARSRASTWRRVGSARAR